jgi:3-oxoacyl-[acyl-carrier protein] reductase
MKLKQKTALITGASSGIGFGIASELSQIGYKVIINSKSDKKLKAAAKKIPGSIPLSADISCPEQAKNLMKKVRSHFKNIDVLVCNVGSGSSSAPGKENYEDWQKMFDVNFFSTTNIIENSRNLVTKKTGSIICISSICGIDYIPGAPITYSVAKAALNHYIKLSAREFAKNSIRINGIAPGNILFKDSVWNKKMLNNKKAVMKMLNDNVALKRFGSISEIISLVLFLSSKESEFITGSIIPIDGGQLR